MFIIGIDTHKGSHTAVAVDRSESVVDTIRVEADRHQRSRLLEWATWFEPRSWAVEGAMGMGRGWPSSSSAPASMWSMCQRSCRRGCGCSSVAGSTRPTPTTPVGGDRGVAHP